MLDSQWRLVFRSLYVSSCIALMIVFHDPRCADYGSYLRPEQPARVLRTTPRLQEKHPNWRWEVPRGAEHAACLRAHTASHLQRITHEPDFDADTPYFPGVHDHARRAAGAAMAAADAALTGEPAFSLMRPPGHHATADQAMGFCYLNSIAIAALHAKARGLARVAVWDFDAHHGNGTEAILHERSGLLFASVHQYPGYPGSGTSSFANCHNWPVAPRTPRADHLAALRASLDTVIAFKPDLVLVSAGFDAYARDPITVMSLEKEDFATLGTWLRAAGLPTAAVLEGGYSHDLPELVDAFLTGWAGEEPRR
jgi:acetoin utilization deacetylase AcuC-like enzyme